MITVGPPGGPHVKIPAAYTITVTSLPHILYQGNRRCQSFRNRRGRWDDRAAARIPPSDRRSTTRTAGIFPGP